jgi:lysozyme
MISKTQAAVAALSISATGLSYIQGAEGLSYGVYLDPVGLPTVCYGHFDQRLKVGTRFSDFECLTFLKYDLKATEDAIRELVMVPLTQGQYDALVSFVFNVGPEAFKKSALRRKLNQGDYEGAAAEFPKWVYAKGKKLKGLINRRQNERRLFEGK